MLSLDHVIYAVEDFDAAKKHFWSEYGLDAVRGGRHTGHGTGNWILPLGASYLELMSVIDRAEAEASPMGTWLDRRIKDGGGFAGLCLATDDIESISSRLGLEAVAMSRANHDGSTVRWRVVGLEAAFAEAPLPFFIQWDIPPELHPGSLAASHRINPRGIEWVELNADEETLNGLLGDNSLDIRVVSEGRPGVRAACISTDEGGVVIR